MKEKKQINFLFAEDYLGSYPSLINALSIIDSNKIKSNFIGFFFKSSFPDYPKFINVNYRLINRGDKICRKYEIKEQKESLLISYIEKIINKLKINLYFIIKYNLLSTRKSFAKIKEILWILYLIRKNDSVIKDSPLICIDSITLISAYIYKTVLRKRFEMIFWSLEISSYSKIDLLDRLLHKIESHALKNVISIISQSKERLDLITNFKKTDTDNVDCFFVPHSRIKTASIERKDYFNDAFNIRKENTIILHLGWVHDVMDSYNLAKSSLSWKSNLQLVFHERAKRDKNDLYIKSISDLNSQSVHLSLRPVPYENLGNLIASCDIGIVVYKPDQYGGSWTNIAKASGKLADYLAFGKPVICSNQTELKILIEKYGFGFTFDDYSEIPFLVSKISEFYDHFSANALMCFNEEFEFSKFFNPFLNKLTMSKTC
jgi:hypothetical protein